MKKCYTEICMFDNNDVDFAIIKNHTFKKIKGKDTCIKCGLILSKGKENAKSKM